MESQPSSPLGSSPLSSLLGKPSLPTPVPQPDGIWFARNNGDTIRFSEPFNFPRDLFGSMYRSLRDLSATPDPGVYVILVGDNSARPRPFRALYFGQSGNMNERVTSSHERYGDWCRAAGGADNLRVAYHWMFGSTQGERESIESGLIEYYRPECNVTFNPFASSPFARDVVPSAPATPASIAVLARLLYGK